ncbi:amino acid permease/ SLC12A domain-containing protein [Dichotomocladium elegans]|nr:amino acid permease/ SLC12A domain-containing protein [Dichotomocladium elegans]
MFWKKKDEDFNDPSQFENSKIEETYNPTDHASLRSRPDTIDLQEGMKRGLHARHIQMIALGGAIGTGLFLNSGGNIATGGPAGAFIAYCVVGFMVYCIMTCLGEMATYMPVSGSFNHYATQFVDPALGFALGWNYWFSVCAVTIATELAAAATIISWWKPVMPDPAWSTIFMVLILAINLVGVRLYGELEYWFALIKILVVIMFIIVAILVTTGAVGSLGAIGFKYWNDPGAFVDTEVNGAVGTISVLLSAGFSFQGTEIVGLTAGEAKNPTRTIPRAIRNTFYRIVFFYIVTIFLIGLCIPYDDPQLAAGENSTTASFTLIFQRANMNGGAHFVNVIILLSVLSAANSSLYTTSRTLLGLARDGNAPRFLGKTNRFGSPYYAVVISSISGFACVFASIYSAEEAFVWFMSITAVSGFISWWGIAFVHLRFRRAYIAQGRRLEDLPYRAFAYPYSGIFACVLTVLIILGQGYSAFIPWDAITFVTLYIGIVPVFICYFGHKIVRRTKVTPLLEVDFETGRVHHEDVVADAEETPNFKWYQQILAWIF